MVSASNGHDRTQSWDLGNFVCVCAATNVLLITHVTLFVYINTESLSLSLTRSLSLTTTTCLCQRSPPPHAGQCLLTSMHHHHSMHRPTPTISNFYYFFFFFFASAVLIATTTTTVCVDSGHHHHHSSIHIYHHTHISFYVYLFFFTSVYIHSVDGHHHLSASMATNTTVSARTHHAAGEHYFTMMYSMVLTLFFVSVCPASTQQHVPNTSRIHTHVNHCHLLPIDKSCKFFFCFLFFSF